MLIVVANKMSDPTNFILITVRQVILLSFVLTIRVIGVNWVRRAWVKLVTRVVKADPRLNLVEVVIVIKVSTSPYLESHIRVGRVPASYRIVLPAPRLL